MLVFIFLQKYVTLQMESMAYIHFSSPLAGAEFSTVGKLVLQQSGPLPRKGIHTVYNVIIIIYYCKRGSLQSYMHDPVIGM